MILGQRSWLVSNKKYQWNKWVLTEGGNSMFEDKHISAKIFKYIKFRNENIFNLIKLFLTLLGIFTVYLIKIVCSTKNN